MWQNFSNSNLSAPKRPWWVAALLPVWVLIAFYASQVIIIGLLLLLQWANVPITAMNETVYNSSITALVYVLAILITIGVPWGIRRSRTTRKDVGLERLPSWQDIALAPAGFFVYLLLSAGLLALLSSFLPFIDVDQAQDVGFSQLTQRYELILAFITLVVIAPVAEEILFRGYLFGKLRAYAPLWVAIIVTSLLFGLVHQAWNVGIDTFALSIILCLLRVVSGSLWPAILLHMIKNGIAFYLLFINPTLFTTLGV